MIAGIYSTKDSRCRIEEPLKSEIQRRLSETSARGTRVENWRKMVVRKKEKKREKEEEKKEMHFVLILLLRTD